jgi:hypothetical protein
MESLELGFRVLLGLVFLSTSVPKLFDGREFREAVANYGLLPAGLVDPVARWLPRVELVAGGALLGGIAQSLVAAVAAFLLAVFAVAVAANLIRGRSIDCGCRGSVSPRRIGWGLVGKDLGLAVMAALLVRAPSRAAILPLPWEGNTRTSSGELIALVISASLLVVGGNLVGESRRVRRALRHRPYQTTVEQML